MILAGFPDSDDALYRVNLATGNREILAGLEGYDPSAMAFSKDGGRILMISYTGRGALSVDVDTAEVRVVSGRMKPGDPLVGRGPLDQDYYWFTHSMSYSEEQDVLYVLTLAPGAVAAIDAVSGDRVFIAR